MNVQPQQARSIFLAAVENHTPDQWESYLNEACGENTDLRHRVEVLLRAHEQANSLLDELSASRAVTVDDPISEHPGTVIGPYKLLQQIGEGGMGVVWMAEQTQPVQRKVALKVIKPGMDNRQVIARFEAERQALAMMDHVNIARVFDGGTTGASVEPSGRRESGETRRADASTLASGRPYFVMELVHGVPITKYCDDNHLTPRQRLELFVPVCQAIQHAHQKGIIHRDIKPSNVMVTLYDGKPVPKVIDFGVAKATEQKLTERTLFTQYGTMVGTLEYMSPEQAEMSALGVDTRSDIYSLGVLLYELLTGSTPLTHKRMKEAAYGEILRMIKEEEPPKPSTRLSDSGEALASISANRHTEPAKLTKLVRGELDWIVMKTLEKDRNRRYETANGFAMDVQRYLADEAVQACPPSRSYRFRKFARRNKVAMLTGSVVALALLVALAVLATSTVLIAREQQATTNALHAETLAKQDLDQSLERERHDSYFHRIALAQSELSVHNLGRALELLDQCPKDLRDWEWRYLQRLCRVDPVTLHGGGNGVRGVAFSPEGRRLAAANDDGTVGLFDVATGAELRRLRGHKAKVRSVAFHPNGTRLASFGTDLTVKVWDLTTGLVVFELDGKSGTHAGLASGVAFSPDGRRLAASSHGGSVVLCDATGGRELHRLPGHERMAVCVAFSPDGRLLATGDWAGMLQVWDVDTGDRRWFKEGDGASMGSVAFSPDGKSLATAGYDRLVKLWDVATRDLLRTWRGHDCIIVGLAFSLPDGRRLATIGGEDKTVKLWDPLTRREILTLRGHASFGAGIVFSPDGQRLASCGLDGKIRIWDASPANAGQEQLTLKHEDEVWSVAFSPDGQRIASASWDKTARLWDATTGDLLHSLKHPSQVHLLAFSRNGERLTSVSRGKTAWIWDATTGAPLGDLTTSNEHLMGVTFSPDGQYLLVDDMGGKQIKEGENHAVTVWDARADQVKPKVIGIVGRHGEAVWCLKFSPDDKLIASASNDGTVKLWRWDPARPGQPQEPLHSLPVRHYGFGDCVAFTPKSDRLVTVGEQHTVKIWDPKTGKELAKLHGHSGDVIAVAISSNGRWLASAGEDTTIVLWDAETWERRHTLRGHTGMVMSLAFDRDSRRLVSGSRDGKVKVWDMTGRDKVADR